MRSDKLAAALRRKIKAWPQVRGRLESALALSAIKFAIDDLIAAAKREELEENIGRMSARLQAMRGGHV